LPKNILMFTRNNCNELGLGFTGYHQRHVLAVNLMTEGYVFIDGNRILFKPGMALLIFPYQLHYFMPTVPPRLCWVFTTFETDQKGRLDALRNKIVEFDENFLVDFTRCTVLYTAQERDIPRVRAHIQLLAGSIVYGLLQRHIETSGLNEMVDTQPRLIREACQYIYDSISKPIEVADEAKHLVVSSSYVRALFKKTTGRPIATFIREVKLAKALELLARNDLILKEIIDLCGFRSLGTFNRMFRRAWKMSPREYRRRLIKK
jgi:AraC-like DNA-binding protein